MKHSFIGSLILAAAAFAGAETPEVSDVNFTQDLNTRVVTITYKLAVAPAIVTVDIRTNNADGVAVSIGDANITYLDGDVNKLVTAIGSDTTHAITWRPDRSWPDHKILDNSVTALVCAWATNAPPDYLVANLLNGSVAYYTSAECLPAGGLTNDIYKTTRLVLRRIHAAGVEWDMGCAASEPTHQSPSEASQTIKLSQDYYIGIYELTLGQWRTVMGSAGPTYFTVDSAYPGRPVNLATYNRVRDSASNDAGATVYPSAPASGSFLGTLRTKVQNLPFDLPSEAQWEFACRASVMGERWNDGSEQTDANLLKLARFSGNGTPSSNTSLPGEAGAAIVGSYAPNGWGLYDMHGNIAEMCLDYFNNGYVYPNADGAVNVVATPLHVLKGGSWNDSSTTCRSAARGSCNPSQVYLYGFRVACGILGSRLRRV